MAQRASEISGGPSIVGRKDFGRPGCQGWVEDDGLSGAAVRGFHQCMVPLMRLALALNFRRIRVRHAEWVPRHGAVLLLSNHPSTWTDVVLLDSLLGRRFHFLAQEEQFRPWPRWLLLRLYGTLPLSSIEQRPDAFAQNAVTFRRCEALFDRGEGVAVFPEGISRVDRGLLPLRHGAARLALSYAARRDDRQLSLLPVGIHYSDRTAFRGDVTVSVGKVIPAEALRVSNMEHLEDAARHLTEIMARAMRGLVLQRRDCIHARLFSVLEPLAAGKAGSLELEPAQRVARSLDDERRNEPENFASLARRARAYQRMRAALHVSDSALADRSRVERTGAIVAMVVGLVPGFLGLVIHALPGALAHAATRRYTPHPSQVAFARIASGFLFFSLTYAALITLLLVATRPVWVPGFVLLSVLLGAFALEYTRWIRLECERWRIASISRRHALLVRRARRERDVLRQHAVELLK